MCRYKNIWVTYFCLQAYVKYTLTRLVESLPRQITQTTIPTIWIVCRRYNFTLPCKYSCMRRNRHGRNRRSPAQVHGDTGGQFSHLYRQTKTFRSFQSISDSRNGSLSIRILSDQDKELKGFHCWYYILRGQSAVFNIHHKYYIAK